MPFSTADVLQAFDGELFVAPFGTAIPPDIATALDPLFIGAGWLMDSGLEFSPEISAPDAIVGWPRAEILLQPAATLTPSLKFSLAQHDAATLDWIVLPARDLSLVLEYRASQTSATHRLVLPKVRVTESAEMPFTVEDLIGFEVTVGCQRDDTVGVEFTFAFYIPDASGVGTIVKSY